MESLIAWSIVLGGVAFIVLMVRLAKSKSENSVASGSSTPLDSAPSRAESDRVTHNPVNLICFLLIELENLTGIDDVYASLGTGFSDISSDPDVVKDWKKGLTTYEVPHLLSFNADRCNGEMELIFRDGRLACTECRA